MTRVSRVLAGQTNSASFQTDSSIYGYIKVGEVYLLGFFWRMIQRETDAIYQNDKNDKKFKISVANELRI